MRSNVLVAHFFEKTDKDSDAEVADRVRAIVYEIVDGFRDLFKHDADGIDSGRYYIILTRYDLGGESRSAIAADLGIRVSRFYYERRAALARLAEELQRRKSLPSGRHHVTADAFSVQEQCAVALKEAGRSDLSIALLQNLVDQAPDDSRRVYALCRLVELFCDSGRWKEAATALVAARETLEICATTGDALVLLSATIDCAAIQEAWGTGRATAALAIGDRALAQLSRLKNSQTEESQLLLTTLLSAIADIQSNIGMLPEATANFARALTVLDACDDPPAVFRAVLLGHLAFAQAIVPGGIRLARETNRMALAFARQRGLLPNIAQAHINALQFELWRGKPLAALAHGDFARAIHDIICEPVEHGRIDVLYARIEAILGRERSGLRRVKAARAFLAPETYLSILSFVVESEVLLRLEKYTEALQVATLAAETAERIGSRRGRGLAALAMAQAHVAKDEPGPAIEALEVSFEALEKSGAIFPLAQALCRSAELTGNIRHRAYSEELLASLR